MISISDRVFRFGQKGIQLEANFYDADDPDDIKLYDLEGHTRVYIVIVDPHKKERVVEAQAFGSRIVWAQPLDEDSILTEIGTWEFYVGAEFGSSRASVISYDSLFFSVVK